MSVDGAELPRYFDSQYDCEMEILRFDSWAPNPRFIPWIEEIHSDLAALEVLDHRRFPLPVDHRTEPTGFPSFDLGLQVAYA